MIADKQPHLYELAEHEALALAELLTKLVKEQRR